MPGNDVFALACVKLKWSATSNEIYWDSQHLSYEGRGGAKKRKTVKTKNKS